MSEVKNDRASWLQGPQAFCSGAPAKVDRPWRLVLLGAPGVGKGTQAELLSRRLGPCPLSTGDIFRAAKNLPEDQRSPAMNAAVEVMRRGELVPDSTVLDIVRERLRCLRCRGGFLLDGFPRTVAQARALDDLLVSANISLDGVLSYEMPIDEIVGRLSGRRTCANCKAVYHVSNRPPKKPGICDHCNGQLVQRDDDRPESVRVRMQAYEQSTAPLTEYYRERGLLKTISAQGSPDEVYQRTLAALGQTG